MNGLLGSLVWRVISETNLIHMDVKRFIGHSPVLVAMAPDRQHPELLRFGELFAEDSDLYETVIEDHPEGPVHHRFDCEAQEFKVVLQGLEGQVLASYDQAPRPEEIQQLLHASTPVQSSSDDSGR